MEMLTRLFTVYGGKAVKPPDILLPGYRRFANDHPIKPYLVGICDQHRQGRQIKIVSTDRVLELALGMPQAVSFVAIRRKRLTHLLADVRRFRLAERKLHGEEDEEQELPTDVNQNALCGFPFMAYENWRHQCAIISRWNNNQHVREVEQVTGEYEDMTSQGMSAMDIIITLSESRHREIPRETHELIASSAHDVYAWQSLIRQFLGTGTVSKQLDYNKLKKLMKCFT